MNIWTTLAALCFGGVYASLLGVSIFFAICGVISRDWDVVFSGTVISLLLLGIGAFTVGCMS